jgi:hypothetical protein
MKAASTREVAVTALPASHVIWRRNTVSRTRADVPETKNRSGTMSPGL